ncbi:MAG: VTT domain-containing protein [Candidatus Aenigmarchaeota archaeon]|nr:VTT domain-containing protein [Candidatus Aenigmarchaeota archaeon]
MDFFNATSWIITTMQSYTGIWAYPAIFFISFIGNATILFPIPAFIAVFALGSTLNPWLLALFAGAGGALGEITGYGIGYGGSVALAKKYEKWFQRAKKWFETHGAFPIIILFAATPIPTDIVGVLSGLTKYNLKRFLAACFIGKFIMNAYIAWAGFYGISWILTLLGT